MDYKLAISLISLFFSAVALYFTFKKDAHRLRLTSFESMPKKYRDHFSINNDSSFPVRVSAVGHIDSRGKLTWIKKTFEVTKNTRIELPHTIEPRTTLRLGIVSGVLPTQKHHGYCVQLDCGRTFYTSGNLPTKLALTNKLKGLLSRLTSGKYGSPNYLYPE
ncbi:hypothetical protein GNT65_08745 [Shewanella sp. JBTF-M18]|uniref:Uncharacterized protein n=1 Tax=Shewanella insulae TaxID=2681496 RepID=A0A6L7HWP0_9GAMM|nr:hypothetical protein [Shewanella insulae]MXR68757.1 hypothetical protein [Shewanella insulae]